MKAKTLLKSIRSLRSELKLLQKQEKYIFMPRAITYDGIKVQTSPEDRMLETIELSRKLSKKIERTEHQLAMRQLEAVSLIYSLDNPDYRKVLILYYLDGDKQRSWNEVAELVGYSESRVKHFHGWALAEIEKQMKVSTREHSDM